MVNILSIIIGILIVVILIMRESHKIRIAELKAENRNLIITINNYKNTVSNLEDSLDLARKSIVKRNQEIFKMIEGYKNDCRKG